MMHSYYLLISALCLSALLSVTAASDHAPAGPKKSARSTSGSSRRAKNLVVNGTFEKGDRKGPTGWQRPDGLTSFWVKGGRKGRCVKINTDVLNSQFRAREDAMAKALKEGVEPPPPPRRLPTRPPKYDTVAGNDGVHFITNKIPVEPGRHYKLQVDVRVEGVKKASPKVWVKAYAPIKSRGGVRDRIVWKKGLDCKDATAEWATFTTVFPRNTRIPDRVETFRVQLYPYWPAATYTFDNVRLIEIDKEEAEAFDVDRDRKTTPRRT